MGSERVVKKSQIADNSTVYRASTLFVAIFYLLLAVWTFVCLSLIAINVDQWGWANLSTLFMMAFILVYTWYFSVAISYRIRIRADGWIQLTSFRRTIEANARTIRLVEGPRLPIGFMRLRLEREKAYLFCIIRDEAFKRIVSVLRAASPDARFKSLDF